MATCFLAEELLQIFKDSDGAAGCDWDDLLQEFTRETESDDESRYV